MKIQRKLFDTVENPDGDKIHQLTNDIEQKIYESSNDNQKEYIKTMRKKWLILCEKNNNIIPLKLYS